MIFFFFCKSPFNKVNACKEPPLLWCCSVCVCLCMYMEARTLILSYADLSMYGFIFCQHCMWVFKWSFSATLRWVYVVVSELIEGHLQLSTSQPANQQKLTQRHNVNKSTLLGWTDKYHLQPRRQDGRQWKLEERWVLDLWESSWQHVEGSSKSWAQRSRSVK